MSRKDLDLTDEQYLERLQMVREAVLKEHYYWVVDSDSPGDKYTASNVGLCNDELATKEMALFPHLYDKGWRSPKYPKSWHLCPFDNRLEDLYDNFEDTLRNGCWWTCSLRKRSPSKKEALRLVDLTIKRIKRHMASKASKS